MGAVAPEVALAVVRSAIGTIVGCARSEPVADAVTSVVICVPGTVGDVGKPPVLVGGTVVGSVVFSGAVDAGAVVHVATVGGPVASVGSAVGIPVAVGIGIGIALDVGVAVGVFVDVTVGVAVAVAVGTGSAVVVRGARTATGSAAVAVAFPGKIEAVRDGSAGETNPTVKSTAQAMTPAAMRPLSMPLSSMGGRPGDGTVH